MLETRSAPAATENVAWTAKDLLDTDTLSTAEIDLIMETAEAMREVRSRPVGKVATLRGANIAAEFKGMVDDYIRTKYQPKRRVA